MAMYPQKDNKARKGSNLRAPLHDAGDLARLHKIHERLARDYHRQSRRLFSKADLRRVAEIADEIKRKWREASVKAGGDSERMDTLKASARQKLRRQLARVLPNYRKAQALRRAHLRDVRKLLEGTVTGVPAGRGRLAWGDITAGGVTAQQFVPPYSVFDVETIDDGHFIKYDESFATPTIGHLVNNIIFHQDEHTSYFHGLFGLLTRAYAANRVSCGVAYTAPASGRLQISAVFQNFYNKVMFSVHDNVGFSSADVKIALHLFVAIVRGSKVIDLTKQILFTGLISHGDELSYALSDLDDTVPYTVSFVTDEAFNANESVQILTGSEVRIGTVLDDMHCNVNAVLWWQLKKLTVGRMGSPVVENPR